MFSAEMKNVIKNRTFAVIFIFSLLLNVFLIFKTEYERDPWSDVTVSDYNSAFDKVLSMKPAEAKKTLKKLSEKYAHRGDIKQRNIYRTIYNEIRYAGSFDDYYIQKKKEYDNRNDFSIFRSDDEYTDAASVKTLNVLGRFRGTHITVFPSRGIRIVLNDTVTDVILIFLTAAFFFLNFMKDKENGVYDFIRTMKNGRSLFILTKAAAAGVSVFASVLIFTAADMAAGWYIYGLGPLNRSLQSVSGYIGTGTGGTVLSAVVLMILAKTLALFVMAGLIMLLMVVFRKTVTVFLVLTLWLGTSAALYSRVSENTAFSNLKNINIFAFINTGRIFSSYRNIRIGDTPAAYTTIFVSVSFFCIFTALFISVVVFADQKLTERSGSYTGILNKIRQSGKISRVRGIFSQESFKTGWHEKCAFIMLAAVIFTAAGWTPVNTVYDDESDVFYRKYMDELEGKINSEKIVKVLKIKNDVRLRNIRLSKKLKKARSETEKYYIYRKYRVPREETEAVNRLVSHTRYLTGVKGGAFYYPNGYERLTGGLKDSSDAYHAMLMIILLILVESGIFTYDSHYGMTSLIWTQYRGRDRLPAVKIIIGLIYLLLSYMIVYGSWYYNILSAYGTAGLDQPVTSMEHISVVYSGMSVLRYLIYINIMRFSACLIMMLLEFYISAKTGNQAAVCVVCSAVFLVPMLLYLSGIDFCKWILFDPLMIVNGL